MMPNQQVEAWARRAASWFERQGASSKAALQFARLYGYSAVARLSPRPTSIWRDPAKQKAMRAAWDAGNRQGLRARPAISSLHTETGFFGSPASRAMDMPSNNDSRTAEIARALGLGTGASFKSPDPGHYHMP